MGRPLASSWPLPRALLQEEKQEKSGKEGGSYPGQFWPTLVRLGEQLPDDEVEERDKAKSKEPGKPVSLSIVYVEGRPKELSIMLLRMPSTIPSLWAGHGGVSAVSPQRDGYIAA